MGNSGSLMAEKRSYSGAISDILLKKNMIAPAALEEAKEAAKKDGLLLDKYLVQQDLVPSAEVTLAMSQYLGVPPVPLAHFSPDPQLLEMMPRELMIRHLAVPIAKTGKNLTVALGDPFDMFAIDDLQTLTGCAITPLIAGESDIKEALERLFPNEGPGTNIEDLLKEADPDLEVGHEKVEDGDDDNIEMILESAEGAPVIRMVNMILLESLRTGASDIHLEPQEKTLRLRYRIDGALVASPSPPKSLQGAVISRMKIMSGMDITERRVPQDGRMKIRAMGKEVDLRVNTLPTVFGEKIVMRILDRSALLPNLAALGLDPEAYDAMEHGIAQPHGILLVTGPTGSGKTTTLYSCLQELNTPEASIITCEDPVEYQLAGINQVQINSFVGMTFASALRACLRQCPDIILVGETRDGETAEIAIKAALTGHLVLSTLHTNDAAGAITRMIDMGVDPSLLASSLILSQAQRLIRRLCPACRRKCKSLPLEKLATYEVDPAFFEGATVYEPKGCAKCHNIGYKGRAAIMEVLPISKALRRDILAGVSSKVIQEKAQEAGMLTLKDVGMIKVKEGITGIHAALSVTGGGE